MKMMEESNMVMEKVRPHLAELSQLAPQLNEATDRYMKELREIEAQLEKLSLGLEVELDREIEEGNRFEETNEDGEPSGVSFHSAWNIGYGRGRLTGWCLFVRHYTVYDDDRGWCEEDTTPLLSASRDLRIAAADKIPALLEEIGKRVKEKISDLKKVSDNR